MSSFVPAVVARNLADDWETEGRQLAPHSDIIFVNWQGAGRAGLNIRAHFYAVTKMTNKVTLDVVMGPEWFLPLIGDNVHRDRIELLARDLDLSLAPDWDNRLCMWHLIDAAISHESLWSQDPTVALRESDDSPKIEQYPRCLQRYLGTIHA